MKWRHLDLFSGIGGFSLAAQWVWGADLEVVAFCEKDEYCRKVLTRHWPNVPIVKDIRDVKDEYGTIDMLTGGFPCQPFSVAGKQRGKDDDRFLWPSMLDAIEKTGPTWVVVENVIAIDDMLVLDQIISDLESLGYEVGDPLEIPACAVGADHRRLRTWVVGDSYCCSEPDSAKHEKACVLPASSSAIGDTVRKGPQGCYTEHEISCGPQAPFPKSSHDRADVWSELSRLGGDLRIGDGLSVGMVRHMVKALGNAILPAIAGQIMSAIKYIEAQE